ncbi:hypothetical protein GCM10011498_12150 [Amylibacter cionae]|uniref:Uncharacterized protein n=1 Tax=Neptunicoccus cionae TaxID=2035344 RepID=A0A916VP51_9RHOB|nr:hypothetical protein GCM10011498_12150 [Amylibacter cionae]
MHLTKFQIELDYDVNSPHCENTSSKWNTELNKSSDGAQRTYPPTGRENDDI